MALFAPFMVRLNLTLEIKIKDLIQIGEFVKLAK